MYALGEGVPQDEAEAVRWLRLAADQGIAGSIHQSGVSEVINDCENDPRFYKIIDQESGFQIL